MSESKRRKVESLDYVDNVDLFLSSEGFLSSSSNSVEMLSLASSNTQEMLSRENSLVETTVPHFRKDTGSPLVPTVVTPSRNYLLAEQTTDKTATWVMSAGERAPFHAEDTESKHRLSPTPTAPPSEHTTDDRARSTSPKLDITSDTERDDNSSSPKPFGRRSPLIRQAATPQFTFSQDDTVDENSDLAGNGRAVFLRQISAGLLSGTDEVDAPCQGDNTCIDIVTYLRHSPPEVQTMVANYLSSGKLDTLNITQDNIHYFLHVATSLSLPRLKDHCMEFCFENNHREILSLIGECGGTCKTEIENEVQSGFERTLSILSDSDDSLPPEYLIVFSRDDSAKKRTTVNVLDMSDRLNIFQRQMEKPYQFGHGFACTSIDIKDAPYVFVSGGEGKGLKSMFMYDVLMSRWTKCAKMNHGRSYHDMVTVGDKIYVIGGAEVACVEEYDPSTDKWTDRASLAVPVYKAAMAVHGSKIFIFGGRTPAGGVSSLQIFETNSGSIQKFHDLPVACYGGCAVAVGHHIFFASHQGHMMCLDTATGCTELCAQQPIRRKYFKMFTKHERLYIVGGVPPEEDARNIQSYPQYRFNPYKNSWVQKEKLNKCFPVYASCVVKYPKKCPVVPFENPI